AGYGLVDQVTEKGEALAGAMDLAARVSKNAPLGLIASKALIREMQGRTEAEFWAYQAAQHMHVFQTEDAIEGATAFAEKREPNWQGK
ncbi:MAG: enoyl-CoA hydratase, partial [Actinomycetia bacterium]|nr:enoyl-CoA hydratase [Actinomycetes bacterium]